MISSVLLKNSGVAAQRASRTVTGTIVRTFAVTPRSAATPDPDADDDNILP